MIPCDPRWEEAVSAIISDQSYVFLFAIISDETSLGVCCCFYDYGEPMESSAQRRCHATDWSDKRKVGKSGFIMEKVAGKS